MNKTRNPNATCGNCPYWLKSSHECRNKAPKIINGDEVWIHTGEEEWCGEHPDFWQAEAPEETAALIDPSNSLDAYVWAKAFCQRFGGDEMLMLSWFANAIERGRDAGRGATDREQQLRAALEGLCEAAAKARTLLMDRGCIKPVCMLNITLDAAKEALHD